MTNAEKHRRLADITAEMKIKELEIQIAGLELHIADLQTENRRLVLANSEIITAMIRASK